MKKISKIKIPAKPKYIRLDEKIDFFLLFKKIEQVFETCFIFESLGEDERFSRYSVIGFDPDAVISARKDILSVGNKKYKVKNPYYVLRQIMPDKSIARNYSGGLIGYLSYEALNYFEPSLNVKVHKDFEQFMFGVYTDGLILDKLTNELFYFYHNSNRIDVIHKIISSKLKNTGLKVEFLRDSISKEEHGKIVQKVKEHILSGNTFQCEVGFKKEYKVIGNTLKIYDKLRKINPSPFMYFLKFGKKKIIGASPELMLSLRNGELCTILLAGTTKRGKDKAEDSKLAKNLLNDKKERAEHSMLVDLHRNDIGRVARFGTVKIHDLMNVKKFSHVQHISSEIGGIINNKEDAFSALANNFPMGTVSGAPKIETIKIININEKDARGPYGGGVGHFGFNGDCTFALDIRSIFIAGDKAYTQTSSGIVYDSNPDDEYVEIQRKSEAMQKALNI